MKNLFPLISYDFKNIFRDPILVVLLFVPILIILLVRFGLPPLVDTFPVIEGYQFLIVMLFALLIASFPAFIISFIMLDEKDEGIFVYYKVLPLSDLKFLFYRLGFIILFAWFYSLILLITQTSVAISLWQMLLSALLFALIPPIITLITVTFSRNKIEGVTMMKVLNLLLFIPVAAFFIHSPWKYIFGIIPVFWSFQTMEITANTGLFLLCFFTGILLHAGLLLYILKFFIKRI